MRIRHHLLTMSIPAILAGASFQAFAQPSAPPTRQLMPVPEKVQWGSERLPVTQTFAVHVPKATEPRLERAIDRMSSRLEGRLGFEIPRGRTAASEAAALVVEVERTAPALPVLGDDESYVVEVKATQAVLRAPTTVGALRGLETVLQLLEGDRDGWYLPAVTIEDRPRFTWRGLMIDVGRHWMPIEVIKRNLDGMAAMKLNVLHLHLTEDQGFRIESR